MCYADGVIGNPSVEYRSAMARLLTHNMVAAHLSMDCDAAVRSLMEAADQARSATSRKVATPWVADCYTAAAYWLSVRGRW